MALIITDDCINCSACEAECPAKAIFPMAKCGDRKDTMFINNKFLKNGFISFEHYYIDMRKCNECSGTYLTPRCNEVCPVSCCISEDEFYSGNPDIVKVKTNPLLISKISLN